MNMRSLPGGIVAALMALVVVQVAAEVPAVASLASRNVIAVVLISFGKGTPCAFWAPATRLQVMTESLALT